MVTARNDSTGDALVSKVLVQDSKKNFDIGYDVLTGVKNDDGTVTIESGTFKFVNGEWVAIGQPPVNFVALEGELGSTPQDNDLNEEVRV